MGRPRRKAGETHREREMTEYRRNFVPGGSYFFTVNLAGRRLRLLTEHIEKLRAAFRPTRRHHPFTVDAIVVLPDHLHAIWTLPKVNGTSRRVGGWPKGRSPAAWPEGSGSRPAAQERASVEFGSAAIGNTRFAMKTTSRDMPITSISTL